MIGKQIYIKMNNKEFSNIFQKIAVENNFNELHGGWFRESNESIIILNLQKSNFKNNLYLNIKIYFKSIFGNKYILDKKLVKNDIGDIFRRQPKEFDEFLDFDNSLSDNDRIEGLNKLFKVFILPLSDKALSKIGLIELDKQGVLFLFPAVKSEIET